MFIAYILYTLPIYCIYILYVTQIVFETMRPMLYMHIICSIYCILCFVI